MSPKKTSVSPQATFLIDEVLVNKIATELRLRGETLSCAESCTGGLLSARLTALAGVSDIYMGSVIAYSNQVKIELLSVPVSLIRVVGAVSLGVAGAMAKGARKVIHSDWAIGVTGVAGPGGGSIEKPVGTVCFGIVGPGIEMTVQQLFSGNRVEIQARSANFALRLLAEQLGLDLAKV